MGDKTASIDVATCSLTVFRSPHQTVCVRPGFVERCVSNLKGSDVKVASVIGFHEGSYDTYHKLQHVVPLQTVLPVSVPVPDPRP